MSIEGFELTAAVELSRDRWIAGQAAARIAEGEAMEHIDTEALDALANWISFELIDRSNRNGYATIRW